VAVHHDVDLVADRRAHGFHAGFGQADRPQPFDRHRRGHGHALERRESIGHRLLRQVGESLGFVDTRFVEIFEFASTQMAVGADLVAHRPAPKLSARQARDFAENVPQRQIDAGDGRRPHDAMSVPEVLAIHDLPQMLDPPGILAHDELRQIFHRSDDRTRMPFKRGFTPAKQPRLIR
jgi:hypothetical protein